MAKARGGKENRGKAYGKDEKAISDAAHRAVSYGAMILAGTAAERICNPERRKAVREEFERGKIKA